MKDMIYLPKSKAFAVFQNAIAVLWFLLESDFLKKPISEPPVLLVLCFCVFAFFVSMIRICISDEKIEVHIWRIPVRRIPADKIARIEIIEWTKVTHIVFEIGKCPRFRERTDMELLDHFLLANLFSTVEYEPPDARKNDALELIRSAFPGKVYVVEKDY